MRQVDRAERRARQMGELRKTLQDVIDLVASRIPDGREIAPIISINQREAGMFRRFRAFIARHLYRAAPLTREELTQIGYAIALSYRAAAIASGRSEVINIRVTLEDWEVITNMAAAEGKPAREWLYDRIIELT